MERTRAQAGFSLVELMMGITIFVISVIVLGTHVTTNYSTTQSQRDVVFAYTKAQAILSEIHSFVDRGEIEAAVDLDVLDDGIVNRPVLTVATDDRGRSVAADHPLSGNFQRNDQWVWSRIISVRPFTGLNNRNVRYVTVRVFKRDNDGVERELASLSSVINSVASSFPTTQVFDVFLLAIESIPGWWVHMESIVPFVESAITDLENRNPGLSIRTHWITKAGYGRNPLYRASTNEVNDSYTADTNVYVYPGKMPSGNASSYYYVPDMMRARVVVDGVERHGYDADTNPYPYSLSDFYNHALRYPQAKAFHEARVQAILQRRDEIAAATLLGTVPPPEFDDMSVEPTLQMLLEDMSTDPDAYRHALIVNLHGELLPVPALRNYSDPAKLPDRLPGVRVVTHPEELRTARPGTAGDNDVRLRVYAYRTDPDDGSGDENLALPYAIYLQIMDVDITNGVPNTLHPDVRIEKLDGGVAAYPSYDTNFVAASPFGTFGGTRMQYYTWFVNLPGQRKFTAVLLVNTPIVSPSDGSDRGLRSNLRSRLYDLEYVPSCTDTDGSLDFSRHLGSTGNGPKNTARWRITLGEDLWDDRRFYHEAPLPPPASPNYDPNDTTEPDHMLVVRTRIADLLTHPADWPFAGGRFPLGSNATWEEPENFSETYTWWADETSDVPITERSQFMGDPRHNPYKDLLSGDADFPDGYNWFFDALNNSSQNARNDFRGLTRLWNRWGEMRQDLPRLFELYREGIATTRSIYTTLTGYSNYYVGIGNEIGYDGANGYASSIPVHRRPWGTMSNGYVDNITGQRCLIREATGSDYWWGIPWLGELYPDSVYTSQWFALDADGNRRGNLDSGNSSSQFYRGPEETVYGSSSRRAYGTLMQASNQRTSTRGCVSFFNNGTSTAHFDHSSSSGSGYLVGAGLEIAQNYGFPMPSAVEVTRPFALNTNRASSPEFSYEPWVSRRYGARLVETFFNHPTSSSTGSGLVEMVKPDGSEAGYIVVNGIAQTTTIGTSFIAKYCLLSMYQSFFESGAASVTYRIPQPARVQIMTPTEITELNDPSTIPVQFATEWRRWDGQAYTATTPGAFAESEAELEYVISYSPDGGDSWRYVQNNLPSVPGERPSDASLFRADEATGDETYHWSVPGSGFPEGSYLVRVECYRQNQSLHYSQHQVKIYIAR